jgi:hypothetical protein
MPGRTVAPRRSGAANAVSFDRSPRARTSAEAEARAARSGPLRGPEREEERAGDGGERHQLRPADDREENVGSGGMGREEHDDDICHDQGSPDLDHQEPEQGRAERAPEQVGEAKRQGIEPEGSDVESQGQARRGTVRDPRSDLLLVEPGLQKGLTNRRLARDLRPRLDHRVVVEDEAVWKRRQVGREMHEEREREGPREPGGPHRLHGPIVARLVRVLLSSARASIRCRCQARSWRAARPKTSRSG